jgi:hypothetical protein
MMRRVTVDQLPGHCVRSSSGRRRLMASGVPVSGIDDIFSLAEGIAAAVQDGY